MYTLGLEFSTQSVKTVVLDIMNCSTVYTGSFDYDTAFPMYQTHGGVLYSENPDIRHTSPFMLIKALEAAFSSIEKQDLDLSLIQAIKIDAMQHCTVYVNARFDKALHCLDPSKNLLDQLSPAIARNRSPIWEDRSTFKEIDYLNKALKEKGGIVQLTGNRPEMRFPAAQILKWAKQSPAKYQATSHIFLLSAFLTSILAGKTAPVDTGDGWGTNLNTTDIHNPGWDKAVLSASDSYLSDRSSGTSLKEKVGPMVPYDHTIGYINTYFAEKYGLNPKVLILAGTGDNPATLLGCGGHAVISLGSSYTVNGIMKVIRPSFNGEYNIFGYTPGRAMALSVFTNGGKVHAHFLKKYISRTENNRLTQKDWDDYTAAAGTALLKSDEKLMLPYLQAESVPLKKRGIIRDNFSENAPKENIRALAVSQALSLKLHSTHLEDVNALCVVGGGSKNRFFNQLIADMFNAKTFSIKHARYAAPFGCAVSGAKKILGISYDEAAQRFMQKDETASFAPIDGNKPSINILLERYKTLENRTTD